MNRARKPAPTSRLQEVELIPVTDLAQQAALDRIFKGGRISKQDRKLLAEARKPAKERRQN